VLSNGFAFTLCNLHNLTFRGLDLAYMPSLQALQIVIVPTPARLGLHSVHPRDSSTCERRQVLPRSFTAEDHDEARFITGEDQTTRREDLDGATAAERGMPRYEGARRAKNYRRRRKSRAKRKGKKVWAQNFLKCQVKMQNRWRSRLFILTIFI